MKFWTLLALITTLSFALAVLGVYLHGDWSRVGDALAVMMFAWCNADAQARLAELKPDA